MNWQIRLAVFLFVSALLGCARGDTARDAARHAPYTPENNANMHDSSGGAGGGGM